MDSEAYAKTDHGTLDLDLDWPWILVHLDLSLDWYTGSLESLAAGFSLRYKVRPFLLT